MLLPRSHMILFVSDQERSKVFYENVLDLVPILHAPGMTEFQLNEGFILGLMPEASIKKLLGENLPNPSSASGVPRAELYIQVKENESCKCLARAVGAGATGISPARLRDWGDIVSYCLDLDGHVLAFAERRI